MYIIIVRIIKNKFTHVERELIFRGDFCYYNQVEYLTKIHLVNTWSPNMPKSVSNNCYNFLLDKIRLTEMSVWQTNFEKYIRRKRKGTFQTETWDSNIFWGTSYKKEWITFTINFHLLSFEKRLKNVYINLMSKAIILYIQLLNCCY